MARSKSKIAPLPRPPAPPPERLMTRSEMARELANRRWDKHRERTGLPTNPSGAAYLRSHEPRLGVPITLYEPGQAVGCAWRYSQDVLTAYAPRLLAEIPSQVMTATAWLDRVAVTMPSASEIPAVAQTIYRTALGLLRRLLLVMARHGIVTCPAKFPLRGPWAEVDAWRWTPGVPTLAPLGDSLTAGVLVSIRHLDALRSTTVQPLLYPELLAEGRMWQQLHSGLLWRDQWLVPFSAASWSKLPDTARAALPPLPVKATKAAK